MGRVRTEASVSLTLAWDPTKPVDPEDVPALRGFLEAFRALVRVPAIRAAGQVSLLEAAVAQMAPPRPALPTAAFDEATLEPGLPLRDAHEKRLYEMALQGHGSARRAARTLGMCERTLRNRCQRFGVPLGRQSRAVGA